MTFAEMGTALDVELDESQGLWFNDDEKSYFLNKATEEFVKDFYEQFEVNEHARSNLRPLVKDSAPQVGSTFLLASITDLYYILKVSGTFSGTVDSTAYTVTRNIKPEQNDDLVEQDPFGSGTNADPKYVEVNNTLSILSTTPPTNVVVRYLKTPKVIDIAGLPLDTLDLPVYTHSEIVSMAKDAMLENIGSPRYPNSKVETAEEIS